MSKIVTYIKGGIGNQLFCYAAARRLALTNGSELIIDNVSGFVRDHRYQRCYQLDKFQISCRHTTLFERMEPFSTLHRYWKRRLNSGREFENKTYIHQENMAFDVRLLKFKPQKTIYLDGYWQSELYFKDIEDIIREDLSIVPPKDEVNMRIAKRICDTVAVAVHIRFFDNPGQRGGSNIASDYYVRAISHMEKVEPNAHYYIFSDRPKEIGVVEGLPEKKVTWISHNVGDEHAYADLWLMTQCKHFIIANSTFSWWGAWLASYPDKIVIAPDIVIENGITAWGFEGLLPEHWIKL